MKTFQDNTGRTWTLKLSYGSGRRVKADTGIDVLNNPGGAIADMGEDVTRAIDVLWSLVQDQAAVAGITVEKFVESIDPGIIDGILETLLEEIADFFRQNPRVSQQLAKIRETGKNLESLLLRDLEEMDPEETANRIYGTLKKSREAALSNTGAAFLPAKSASTPTPGPSENSPGPSADENRESGSGPAS